MRDAVIRTLGELAAQGHDVHLITGDLGFKILDEFRAKYPARFTNAGVAEANMISVAAGMAMAGKRVFCYSMAPFVFLRAFEQVRMDLCAQCLPVTLIGVGGGLSYGCEGFSHHAIEDLAIARALPNLVVLAPGDPAEAVAAVRSVPGMSKPCYLRLGKNGDPAVHRQAVSALERPLLVEDHGDKLAVFCTGHILARTAEAVRKLAATGVPVRLFSVPMLKPFDKSALQQAASTSRLIVTVEEHGVIGGLGTEVAEVLLGLHYSGKLLKIGLPDECCVLVGGHEHLCKHYGLDAPAIEERIRRAAGETGISK